MLVDLFFLISGLIWSLVHSYIGLEHATIKDNIIFGSPSPFDEARYQSVLDACALRQDLAIFDAGDMTGQYLSATAFALHWCCFLWRNWRKGHYPVRRSACSSCTSSSNVFSRKGVHLRTVDGFSADVCSLQVYFIRWSVSSSSFEQTFS